jgi:hypothetical protein
VRRNASNSKEKKKNYTVGFRGFVWRFSSDEAVCLMRGYDVSGDNFLQGNILDKIE